MENLEGNGSVNEDSDRRLDPVLTIMGVLSEIEQTGNIDSERYEINQIINRFRNQEISGEEAIQEAEDIKNRRIER